ncbi:MAG: phosphoenolpyruvate--protein phosphotransferase [Methylocystis sp.]|nr:phosphoenolpyruvate--protein phosphotransferase [Methylocystis sp.]MCA3583108.1 phosphoenolpyruvate--protein phosphotransferase [Methylocystis sp.]MCA3588387.1 phosphoenolpyruvate--protein phosphotransferase [Methylocystis sp.]MCA3593257.1 phosphoenolpyruvate--protein phosphotransferase [Methylocystis sp.]
MRGALGGPRVLLRRLREVMAEPVSAQERLDRIVVLIAANMVAEVCSVYVLRADGTLELYATEGLNRAAVHLTTMRAGEGLVGLIAETAEALNISDAQTHPRYSYKPETGEEIYNSFLGVPILRAGNTIGVLVVQNSARRTYSEEEMEALQTTAMVIAEMVAGGELEALANPASGGTALRRPLMLTGVPIAEGVGLGHVVLHEPRIVIKNMLADDPAQEDRRLEEALLALQASIDVLISGDGLGPGEHREILETFRMFAHDRGWLRRLREAIASGLTAEAAVERVQSDTRAKLLRQTDPYLRERLHDFDDLANRLLHQLTGEAFTLAAGSLPENAILVARAMGPAALLEYERSRLRGLILEEGGATSHVAVVARALGVPCVGEVQGITSLVEQGDAIIVDGSAGDVQVRPQSTVEASYAEKARMRARRQEQYLALRDQPAVTRDGVAIDLQMNAGLLVDMPQLSEVNAAGIGLFRTEILFMVAPSMPRAEAQEALYRAILQSAGGRPVTFRTLDIGGDKILPYMRKVEEENPALGWRAIRIGLDRPALLKAQFRAILKACAGRTARIMLPMVATVDEYRQAKAMVERERAYLAKHGHPGPRDVKLGAMLEVPALLFDLEAVLKAVDFISVGSNDLMQFLFAVDRDNRRVSGRFDTLNPAMLRALANIARMASEAGKPVTVCGEMAGRPIEALALLALGYRQLSMSPAAIGPVKAMVLGTDLGAARAAIGTMLGDCDGCASLRSKIAAYAEANNITV